MPPKATEAATSQQPIPEETGSLIPILLIVARQLLVQLGWARRELCQR